MRRLALLLAFLAAPALALTPEAREFIEITRRLEPVQCEKRKLRHAIALAEAQDRDAEARAAREKFEALNRDRETARLESRLAVLGRRISDGRGGVRDPEDLEAISRQRREAYYRCE